MPKKVTMQQIADYAGVSKYAVSKALSGQPGVSDETREKIVKIATQLGYFLQKHAQPTPRTPSANSSRANTVVIVLPNIRMQHRESNFWGRIIDGITGALLENGLAMITVTEHAPENFLHILNPDGLLGIIGVGLITNSMLLEIRKFSVPFVLIDHEDETVTSDTLFMDNFDATRRLTNYLIGQGHEVIQFIGDINYSKSFYDRWLAFRTTLEMNNIPLFQNETLSRMLGVNREEHTLKIQQEIRTMAASSTLPTAFVCANDSIAISTIHALEREGIRVPDEVSVTGFDDIDDATDISPALTTVHVDKEILGIRAVEVLLRRLEKPDVPQEKLLLTGKVVFRDSVAPAFSGAIRAKRG